MWSGNRTVHVLGWRRCISYLWVPLAGLLAVWYHGRAQHHHDTLLGVKDDLLKGGSHDGFDQGGLVLPRGRLGVAVGGQVPREEA